jgi:hypothetical protein
MSDNLHDVVKLLLARMKSHPEEFRRDRKNAGRWYDVMDVVRDYGTKEEDDAIDAGLRPIRLQEAHEMMMDELCNGEERRRIEEQEYERDLMNRMRNTLHGVNPTHVWTDDYANVGVGTTAPSQPLVIQSGGTGATRIQTNSEIKIGNETLSEGLLKQIKKALNI